MKATLIFERKVSLANGTIIEMVIWKVPEPVPGSVHLYKYRLFCGMPGTRLVGYDNERGKGDHHHVGELEYPYVFTTIDALLDDFLSEVEEFR